MTPEREHRIRDVVHKRQPGLTVVLENVHDPHNIGAVMRTCESVGIFQMYVLYTDPQIDNQRLSLGKRTSAGSRKWVDVEVFHDTDTCFQHIKKKYTRIYGTHLSQQSLSLYDLVLTESVALVFGNEHDGISEAALAYCDGNFLIPQMGFVQSLNISVACAVTLYEALRQRQTAGMYSDNPDINLEQEHALYLEYVRRHEGN